MKLGTAIIIVAACLVAARPARAEIAFFQTGQTMSIKAHHMDGASLVLTLRSGGEIVCDPSLISRIGPDEVPYPEPEAEPAEVKPELLLLSPAAQLVEAQYGSIIDRFAKEQGVDPKLVRAVIRVESAYQERARSRKGAMGLMQLMPETARLYSVANPYDPVANIEAGIKHLKALLQQFPIELALAAYNAGAAAVQRFRGIPPYRETQNYVSSVMRLVQH
ncbi:MAG TPA: lytic transglycosylase domain-containing protein [Vicinamibacterales bacterium]|nr:lytic transglycosylase domain-containing protein [Vicinamibacterales bacterium]